MIEPATLIVTPVSNLAGVARHIIDLARVRIPGWRMVVAAPEGPLLDELRAVECAVLAVAIDQLAPPRAVTALRDLIKRVRPRIVHSHLARADILAAAATVGLPVKLVTTEHHIPPDRFMFHKSRARAITMETIHHLRLRRFDAAIAVSESTKRDMIRWWKAPLEITVILNGVDRLPRVERPAGLRFLSLTRLSPEKNVSATIRAYALAVKHQPQASLTVAGDGEQAASLRKLAQDLGVQVSFPGFVEPKQTMTSHDVIVQPSKSDNCSYTLLDAVASGMGVAASPIGGNPEFLPPRCIADFDDDEALARVMVEQGLTPELRPELPNNVPTVAGMAEQVADVYRTALEA